MCTGFQAKNPVLDHGCLLPLAELRGYPPGGLPVAFTFVIDAARVADDSWLDEDHVRGYAPMGGQDQITQIADFIKDELKCGKGRIGYETGISNYLPEGNLTQYEYEAFRAALPEATFINAHHIVDRLSLIKDEGTMNRFREASRLTDIGHRAVYEALINGGFKNLTETEISGIATYAMRKAGSEWEWTFTGGNEIASGYRTGYAGGACTPATRRKLQPGESLMVDLHAAFKLGLGDSTVNYLLAPVTERQRWHANNYVTIVKACLKKYRAGITPSEMASEMMAIAEEGGSPTTWCRDLNTASGWWGTSGGSGVTRAPFLTGPIPITATRRAR